MNTPSTITYCFDGTFEGLPSAVFHTFEHHTDIESLITAKDEPPLFASEIINIQSNSEHAQRVWTGLKHRFSERGLSMLASTFLSGKAYASLLRLICASFRTDKRVEK